METAMVQGGLSNLGQKARVEVTLGGFGGQGIVLAGYILGRAAAVHAGRNAVMAQSYGPESRGGACKTDVVIAEEDIALPQVTSPDVVVVMSQEAYQEYAVGRPAHSLLIIDQDLVEPDEEHEKGRVILRAPATRLAEELGRRVVANVVMLGFLCGATRVVDGGAMNDAVAASVPRGTEELNVKAFEAGFEYAQRGVSGVEKGEGE
ncbi:MAG: 2-oxoacid:acceptor oxidoreductase family protein [Dehalococcoidia bacterium]